MAVLFFLSTAALAYLHFFAAAPAPEYNEAEVAAVRATLWRNGTQADTVLLPSTGLQFTIQVGAYKDPSIMNLSYGLEDLVVAKKDSLYTLNVGTYASLPDAQAVLESVIELGMENAFIVAYKDGNPVGLLSVQN